MPLLTVFTPTYNRADLLPRCYEALKRQTLKDFCWLIIDDGSTDSTTELVKIWQSKENGFEIRYVYKENGGLHTGYNTAIEQMDTELAICIDSDDYPPDDCVERIAYVWNENRDEKYAGIIGLDYNFQGECLGDKLPDMKSISLVDLTIGKYNIRNADRKLVVRTELYKQVAPMPTFPGEKNFNPQYMHIKIGMKYEFVVLNECLCYVEYQPNGMSNSMFHQYYNSPNSFAEMRLQDMDLPNTTFRFRLKKAIHYCSSCILAHRKLFSEENNHKMLTVLAFMPGYVLSCIIRIKTNNSREAL